MKQQIYCIVKLDTELCTANVVGARDARWRAEAVVDELRQQAPIGVLYFVQQTDLDNGGHEEAK